MRKKVNIELIAAIAGLLLSTSFIWKGVAAGNIYIQPEYNALKSIAGKDTLKQRSDLQKIFNTMAPDRLVVFKDWLGSSGELPPDFDKMKSVPFLPDPLVLDEGGKNIPITTAGQWKEKREWMRKQLAYYITGTFPPAPRNLKAEVTGDKMDGKVKLQMVELSFGPGQKAIMTVELMIPPGRGPFPVFMTQWNHREWAQVAVRRGYIGCVYAGADAKDDTENYTEIWSGKYDFTKLMKRAFGASRVVDYLYTNPLVDREKIGITGHSRNGKQSMIAAAFDERISACITSSGGTGAEVPYRYNSPKYDVEDIASSTWLHPRLRFFIGRENKLPVDQNLFMALIAPRGLMLSSAINEDDGNPWGIEQAYIESKKVYKFLGEDDNLAIRLRHGLHSVSARDMEDYIDFFDYIFKRNDHKPENRLFFNYSFDKWCNLSGEKIDPMDYPPKTDIDLLMNGKKKKITSDNEWEEKIPEIKRQIRWVMGDEPPGVTNPGPGNFHKGGVGENSFGSFLERPRTTNQMGVMAISPYSGFGDQLFGYLYYPSDQKGNLKNNNLPVVIYLHEYDYSKGFTSKRHQVESLFRSIIEKGYAVFSYDMLGFGNRIEEGTRFYERHPHWSKMGKMVADVRGAVDALSNLDFIDGRKIFVAGYSLGATVGLYATSLDERIAGVISVAGFTPMRLNTLNRGTEGIKSFSHLHGLMPRLGFFVGNETHIPSDFTEVLASIAPRPLLVIAPLLDEDSHPEDIQNCVGQVRKIYELYKASENLQLYSPDDYNRLSPGMREVMYSWLQKRAVE